jgi:two-component system response regulator NreC
MKPVKILLADDHQVVREGVRALLERQPEFMVVGETSDGFKVTGLAERLRPDILIVDLVMPGLGGLDVTREVTRRCAGTRVIVLSMHSSDAYVLQALRDGASAFVLKDASSAELIRAVNEALAGRRYLSPPLSEKAIEAYVKRAQSMRRSRHGSARSYISRPRGSAIQRLASAYRSVRGRRRHTGAASCISLACVARPS